MKSILRIIRYYLGHIIFYLCIATWLFGGAYIIGHFVVDHKLLLSTTEVTAQALYDELKLFVLMITYTIGFMFFSLVVGRIIRKIVYHNENL